MRTGKIHALQDNAPAQDTPDLGQLQLDVHSSLGRIPINDATISISYTGDPNNTLEEVTTNSSGQTDTLTLNAPPLEYSMEPGQSQPYSEYTIRVTAPGYEPVNISGIEILPSATAIQEIEMEPIEDAEVSQPIVIGPHTLYGTYPPKIPEDEIKPVNVSGEIVLSRVVVPEYVIVHDGPPNDPNAPNYYVRYRDYIKNVASSEIYATWPGSTIRANILAIMSFTLNRVYTEWYRNHHSFMVAGV